MHCTKFKLHKPKKKQLSSKNCPASFRFDAKRIFTAEIKLKSIWRTKLALTSSNTTPTRFTIHPLLFLTIAKHFTVFQQFTIQGSLGKPQTSNQDPRRNVTTHKDKNRKRNTVLRSLCWPASA
jgi:hypothetical protein